MQEWLNFSTSFTKFLILVLVEIFVLSYFLVRNPSYRSRIYRIAIYSGIFAGIVTCALLVITHLKGNFLSIIIAVVIVPFIAMLLTSIIYIALALFAFIYQFFTPSVDKPQIRSSIVESVIVGLIGILVAIKILNGPHTLNDFKKLFLEIQKHDMDDSSPIVTELSQEKLS